MATNTRKKAAPVRSIYLENYFTTRRILPVLIKKNKRRIDKLVDALLKRNKLTGSEIEELLH